MKRYVRASQDKITNLSQIDESKFDDYQMDQIRRGLKEGLDVSWYADPKFDDNQMREIRKGLENGVDVSKYADPRYGWTQMDAISIGIGEGLDVSWYADPKFDWYQMDQIRTGLENGLDVSWYADPKFDWNQMSEIRWGLQDGLDVSKYADPKLDSNQMSEIRYSMYSQKTKSTRKMTWSKLRKALEQEAEDGIDSLYEDTKAGSQINSIVSDIESSLGIWAEPSIQGGRGEVAFYTTQDNEFITSMDYRDWNDEIFELAVSANNMREFKQSVTAYYKNNIK